MTRVLIVICIALASTGLVACTTSALVQPTASPGPAPMFDIQPKNATDTITYRMEGNNVVFEIKSPSGIGSASIQPSSPVTHPIVFRLHLRGLERFRLAFGEQTAELELPTGGAPTPLSNVSPDRPLYMPVQIVSQTGTIPLQDGYIEVTAPSALTEAGTPPFSIEWIDFYR